MRTPRHKTRGNGDRSFQSSGKGDADRSPRWRNHYHDIIWPDGGNHRLIPGDGFEQRGRALFKRYGTAQPIPSDTAPAAIIH